MASSDVANPIRPSRQPKESTTLLMSVIRSISSSENDHRDKEKMKLEKEFKRCDQKLDELIAGHHEVLTTVIQVFGKVSSRLTVLREKISLIKTNLTNCKVLLNCRREELKKLWLEGIEYKHELFLLEQIDNLKGSPERVEKYVQKKHYLHATELLVSSLETVEKDLEGVEALKEVSNELLSKKQVLQNTLIDELHHHLYVRSTTEILHRQMLSRGEISPFYRQGSDRVQSESSTPLGKRVERAQTPIWHNHGEGLPSTPTHQYRSNYRLASSSVLPPSHVLDDTVIEDLLLSDPEEDSAHFLSILVKSLAFLNKTPETVETVKGCMQRELIHIVRRTSQMFADSGQVFAVDTDSQQFYHSHNLREFLVLIFQQFNCVAEAHDHVLKCLSREANTANSQIGDIQLYEMADYWSRVQAVLQVLLSEFLDIENSTSTAQRPPSTFVDSVADVASFFAKKQIPRPKKSSLFKFDSSLHAISLNNYLKEQQAFFGSDEMLTTSNKSRDVVEKISICQPSSKNIMVIFIPLMKFIEDIEATLGYAERSHCALHTFVTEFVTNVFLGQTHQEAISAIDLATKSVDAWKSSADLETQKYLKLHRPLLQSTLCVEKHVQELKDIMLSLPSHAESFLGMICNILMSYKETCYAAYQGIVRSEAEEKRIISAMWAKDEDISRFLRSLPNWSNLQNLKSNSSITADVEESPEEVRLRNKKESDILTTNLADAVIPSHEIVSDVGQLRMLAMMQESLEWFGGCIHEFANKLPTNSNKVTSPVSPTQSSILDLPPVPESSVQSIKTLANEFESLAEMCLLVLHLEVRVHCFYHLLPVAKQSSFTSGVDSQDPDPEVVKLNKDMSSIDEALSACLQPRKIRYIFEGLGHLLASIVINSAQYIKRINENGIKKMCRNVFAIQQNLTNITLSREIALDHARHFFELFYHDPEEILNEIVEHGPKFTELDYCNALHLLHRSRPGTNPSEVEKQIRRLHDILNEVAVSI